jgi:hypothetical protein
VGSERPHTLIIACGALAREIGTLIARPGLAHVDITCLPAAWHNRPERIASGVRRKVRQAKAAGYRHILVGYAECGTRGDLDRVCAEEGVERIAGPHCYAFYAGTDRFAAAVAEDADIDAFFLTDFLARHFETLVVKPLGLDRHPELRDAYFGHYRRLIHLAQTEDAALTARAEAAARRLGLSFERRFTGYGDLASFLAQAAAAVPAGASSGLG